MPLSHASRLAKKQVVKHKRDKTSKFKSNKWYKDDNNDDFILELSGSDDFYSEDSDSDSEEFLDQRMQCLSEFKLVWTDTAMIKQKKASYIGNSIATHYRKYRPQGSFTVAAKGTSSLFNFFKPMKDLAEDEFVVDLTGKYIYIYFFIE